MMQNGSCSIVDQRFLYEKYESEFEEGALDPQQIEEYLFNHIVWAPRIWRPCGNLFDCIERPTELGFPYWTVNLSPNNYNLSSTHLIHTLSYSLKATINEMVIPTNLWDPVNLITPAKLL
ncbi:Protein ycf2 [Platanthera guangdongensis]|uniref:Protein ycf2 n=1 Tax=Platanthera guangdongensis TaxID=2320717 RepID=A0ABR2MBH1_9ASPA